MTPGARVGVSERPQAAIADPALTGLLARLKHLHETQPGLIDFAPWPDDLCAMPKPLAPCPIAARLGALDLRGTRATAPIVKAFRQAAGKLHWKQTYTEQEVGAHFLQNYGYVELFGPDGHFQSHQLRGYLGIWGPGLTYDWHAHEAEELYFTLAGSAVFCADGAPNAQMRPGDARRHHSHQRHLMVTLDRPYLAYALWRGPGMADLPRMVLS